MPVKSGRCVKTAALVGVLDYGYAQRADIFEVGDTLVINFGGDIYQGVRFKMEEIPPHQVSIGLEGFYHSDKHVLVVPRHQFQGEIFDKAGKPVQLNFGKGS